VLAAPVGNDTEMLTLGAAEAELPDVGTLGTDWVDEEVDPTRLQAARIGAIPATTRTCLRERMRPSIPCPGLRRWSSS
jgi:hypothetical protein